MGRLISEKYAAWQAECEERFQQLKKNEEELNRIFIDIYGLQDELTPDVADKDVTVHRVFDSKDDVPESMKGSNYVRTMRDEIVSLISYAVGCMFGRYSLDVDGLAYAGGEWDASKYKTMSIFRTLITTPLRNILSLFQNREAENSSPKECAIPVRSIRFRKERAA